MRKTIFEIARYYTVKSIRAIHKCFYLPRGAIFSTLFLYVRKAFQPCIRKNMKSCEKLEFYTRMFRKQDITDNIIPICLITVSPRQKKRTQRLRSTCVNKATISFVGFVSTIESQSTSLSYRLTRTQ